MADPNSIEFLTDYCTRNSSALYHLVYVTPMGAAVTVKTGVEKF